MNKKITKLVMIFVLPFALLTGGNANAIRMGGWNKWQSMVLYPKIVPGVPPAQLEWNTLLFAVVAYAGVVLPIMAYDKLFNHPSNASKEVPVDQNDADEKDIK